MLMYLSTSSCSRLLEYMMSSPPKLRQSTEAAVASLAAPLPLVLVPLSQ